MGEFLAIDAMRDVVKAEEQFLQHNAGKEFTCSLAQLAPAEDKSDVATMLNFKLRIAKAYKIELSHCDATGFHVAAIPNEAGPPVVCADQSGTFRTSNSTVADCFSNGQPVSDETTSNEAVAPK